MKWQNKGHEFDLVGSRFINPKKIVIYGAGDLGTKLVQTLRFADCVESFIDNDPEKQKNLCFGKKVESVIDFMKKPAGEFIVVVAMAAKDRVWPMQQLRVFGYREGEDLFDVDAFLKYYLPIYAFYGWNKLYFHSVGITVTTQCNLRCKGCLAFIPHNHNRKMYDVEMFKESLDSLFQHVDYVDIMQLSGGETFLYPQQEELIEYIGKNYRDKINVLYTTTNGSILPSDSLCESIKRNCVTVILDDYSDTVPQNIDKMKKTIEKLEQYQINIDINKVDEWIDLAPTTTDNSHLTEEELVNYYTSCCQPFIELFENNLYSCNYAQYAMRAELVEDSENDRIDLRTISSASELLEFRMGYTEKGYLEMCKHCSGYWAINKNKVKPAVQGE